MQTAAPVVKVTDYQYPQGWPAGADPQERARHYCAKLEEGNIVLFDTIPFDLPESDRSFLLSQKQSGFKGHKNVSYRPGQDLVRGAADEDPAEAKRLHELMRNYSNQVVQFLTKFLAPYASNWTLDFATWRPLEEKNRDLPLHKRNDLMHVDSFPTRPTNGGRILRVFTNINPAQNRVWITSQTFDVVGPHFAKAIGLPRAEGAGALARTFRSIAKAAHLPGANRSPYDEFMHNCHNAMKENSEFQQSCPKQRWEFPPHSTWIVLTDFVSHAVLEGQYALEQTFIISRDAMVRPQLSPLRILENLAGHPLTKAN